MPRYSSSGKWDQLVYVSDFWNTWHYISSPICTVWRRHLIKREVEIVMIKLFDVCLPINAIYNWKICSITQQHSPCSFSSLCVHIACVRKETGLLKRLPYLKWKHRYVKVNHTPNLWYPCFLKPSDKNPHYNEGIKAKIKLSCNWSWFLKFHTCKNFCFFAF